MQQFCQSSLIERDLLISIDLKLISHQFIQSSNHPIGSLNFDIDVDFTVAYVSLSQGF
jgi:hypothetical protein